MQNEKLTPAQVQKKYEEQWRLNFANITEENYPNSKHNSDGHVKKDSTRPCSFENCSCWGLCMNDEQSYMSSKF